MPTENPKNRNALKTKDRHPAQTDPDNAMSELSPDVQALLHNLNQQLAERLQEVVLQINRDALKTASWLREEINTVTQQTPEETVPVPQATSSKQERLGDYTPMTLNLPKTLLHAAEDYVIHCKRSGEGPRSVSALARLALRGYLDQVAPKKR